MNRAAPAALQPLSANARPARPVYYQSLGSAEAAQHRSAREESPTNRVTRVEHASSILRAVEGGVGFEIVIGGIDYEVRRVSEVEIARRVQSGIRREIEEAYAAAAIEDSAALAAKTTTFVLVHQRWAAKHRSRARELELQLRVSGVRAVAGGVERVWRTEASR